MTTKLNNAGGDNICIFVVRRDIKSVAITKLTPVCIVLNNRCADTVGTVPVPWAGHFRC